MKKILLAEDDKFICRVYGDGLKRAGFDVSVATNGVEAMEKIRVERPDLVLLDLIIPHKNGFDVLADLRLDADLRSTRVVVLSNLSQASDVARARELGAVDYLVKSDAPLQEVIEKVRFHLATREAG